jgi:O-succinylbenzoic acid--CoA ligase
LVRAAAGGGPAEPFPDSAGLRECLAAFDAVLVGGAAPGAELLAHAASLGIRVVETYGCAETCGGIVYDGAPLGGVTVRLAPSPGGVTGAASGRVEIAGPTLALGYVQPDGELCRSGRPRWFRTSDIGRFAPDGRLVVIGRVDDAIVTGGHKVAPLLVEQALRAHPAVSDAVVVGVPSEEWGTEVVALVEAWRQMPATCELRDLVAARIGRHAVPKCVIPVAGLPRLVSGKVDRVAAAHLAAAPR